MVSIRFVHANSEISSVDIYFDDVVIKGLGYKEITPYYEVHGKGKLYIKVGGKVVFKRKIDQKVKHQTAVLAPEGEIVIYDDGSFNVGEGYSRLKFVHLAQGVPPVDIVVDDKTRIQDLKYLDMKKIMLRLGAFFHVINITLNGDEVGKLTINPKNRSIHTFFIIIDNGSPNVLIATQNFPDYLQEDFSLQHYMGKWNLIGEIPQPYITGLGCANQQAIYTLLDDGVKVHNMCIGSDGKVVNEVFGMAVVPDKTQPAALMVTFPPFNGIEMPPPTGANYLVHRVKYDHYSVVGSPNRASFYILAREKKMSKKQYKKLLHLGDELGYDTSKMVVSKGALY